MKLKNRKNLIFEIDENEMIVNKRKQNKNNNPKITKKNISTTTNNSKEKESIFKNLNIRLTENRKRMENSQEKIISLIDSIKRKGFNQKKSKMQRHNTEINFIKNGLNKIYTKSKVARRDNNNNKNNLRIYNSSLFNSNKKIMKTSESMNNINFGKISLNNNKNQNIYVNKVKSLKNIYIPKKVAFAQKYIKESKIKNESPIYRKKNMNNNKINEHYFFGSEKRIKAENRKENRDNNLRMTYSKKYYSKSNPNFFNLNEIKSETYNNNFQQNINLPFLKHFFERDIEELSSIHNDSEYDSYTFDNDDFKNNKIYNNNIINKNPIYIRKTNKINSENINKNNKYKEKKEPQTELNNQKNVNKINLIFTEQKGKVINNLKRNLRYNNSEKEFTNIYISTSNNLTNSKFDKIKVNKGKLNSVNLIRKKIEQHQNNKKEIMYFHLDDFIILEERLKNINIRFNNNKSIYYNCYDFLNYFRNNCDVFKNLNNIIKNENDLKIIQNGINHILIAIIFIYDYSYKKGILNNIILYMKEMLNLTYQNLIFIFDFLLKKTIISENKNIWFIKLSDLINKELEKYEKDNNIILSNISEQDNKKENNNYLNYLEIIKNNTNFILQTIKIITKNFKNKNNNIFLYFLKEINQRLSWKDIFYFFQNKILNSNGLFSYLSSNLILRQNPNLFSDITIPYIKNNSRKKYSLVLGLENTLINFKFDNNISYSNKFSFLNGFIEIRPKLYQFLSEMKKYFELIIFSLYSQKIADHIINIIEKKEKYFDYRFYVQHSIVIENEFVKDLKRIGRPMNKIIIVDSYNQNYKLNKKNAINIRSYWEKDYNDNTLNELGKILVKIINDEEDVRNGIEKYRDEIIEKITLITN